MKTAAIFDMDGLMFDTESVYQKYWKILAEEKGLRLDPSFAKEISGTSGEQMFQIIERYYHSDGRTIWKECLFRVKEELQVHVPEKPGLHELLNYLRDNHIKMAVASSTELALVENNLRNTGTLPYFDVIVSGQDITHGKPAPDIFLNACARLKINPADSYVLEDSFNGIRAAYAAGCVPIMVPDQAEPDAEMRSIAHIYPSLLSVMHAMQAGEI